MMWFDNDLMAVFAWLMMMLFWGAIIVLIIWAVKSIAGSRDQGGRSEAMAILERRFASGEIDREEFEEKRRLLGGG